MVHLTVSLYKVNSKRTPGKVIALISKIQYYLEFEVIGNPNRIVKIATREGRESLHTRVFWYQILVAQARSEEKFRNICG